MYGIRFGAGGGFGSGVLPSALYGQTLNFWSALDVLTTRDNVVAYNQVRACVTRRKSYGASCRSRHRSYPLLLPP